MTTRPSLRVRGAREHNLRDVDVEFGAGITAVVGRSGAGKSSLVFDTVYHEARRRFLATLSDGSAATAGSPARVRAIHGLGPAVAVSQNVLNRNTNSTVATALGVHPLLRVLYTRFAERSCPDCGHGTRVASVETQLAVLRDLVARSDVPVEVFAPLVRGVPGTHARLLAALADRFDRADIEVDGRPWAGGPVRAHSAHDIAVRLAVFDATASTRSLRETLDTVVAFGAAQVGFRAGADRRTLSRAPLCADCGARLPVVRPRDFRTGTPETEHFRLGGRTLAELLALPADAAEAAVTGLDVPAPAARVAAQVRTRLAALVSLGVGYVPLDRRSPSLSRGEAQRLRLAVLLANDVEDLLHVVDEPTIGLGPAQVRDLVDRLARLAGPVVLVEHDRAAVAAADRVVELGPAAGPGGGRLVFAGTPDRLWRADTDTGRWFSGRATPETPRPRPLGAERLTVRGARAHNLTGFDCEFPVGALTVVTGPSGAGKTTLVRDVLVASLDNSTPTGCAGVDGGRPRPIALDQSPIGRNPRSNPATYTGLADRIRTVFAAASDLPGTVFSFNRPEGACPECAGMGVIEVKLRYLPSEWLTCQVCGGRRFGDDALAVRVALADGREYSIDEVYRTTVAAAVPLFANDRKATRALGALVDVGLGYLELGQPSPTLSGGEAQRVKLAKQLAATKPAQLVYLDEPTTGLHPANLPELLGIMRSLTAQGATVVVVEHNPDVVAAADWVVEIGPGGGTDGGRLVHCGPPRPAEGEPPAPRRRARPGRPVHEEIRIGRAHANNLRDVSVTLPKRTMTAVVGVSGSGKSSLVRDVLEAEATRRLLECLSLYERQSVREGPEARVDSVTGLGPTVAVGAERRPWHPRATVGTATELSQHLGVLLAYAGERTCPECGGAQRRSGPKQGSEWTCADCGTAGAPADPSDFSPVRYEAACLRCHGMGTVAVPRVERLITRPDLPLCGGAMFSPGFYPKTYHSKPANAGYWMLRAIGRRYGFDPETTPWQDIPAAGRESFLFGEENVELEPEARGTTSKTVLWRGVYRIFEGWDVGGLYTERVPCPECGGGRLRARFLDVRVAGLDRLALHQRPVAHVRRALADLELPHHGPAWVRSSHAIVLRRMDFLERVGLGYVHLHRRGATLSAGEAQRVRLAALLGADLTGMVVLLDEPSRGLHPREVDALGDTLADLTARGNTVVLVDHDPRLFDRAGHQVVLGPGAGRDGGRLLAAGSPERVRAVPEAADLLRRPVPARARAGRLAPSGWLTVRKPTENNLSGEDVAIPLGVLAGVCGVSGSGKSTLAIDILARALAPKRLTTSVASTPVDPGAHDGIDGAPARVVHADQARSGCQAPGAFLGLFGPLRAAYAESADAHARGLAEKDLAPSCDACKGHGSVREDMGFLPAIDQPCDACAATGYRAEARDVVVRGLSLPELDGTTLADVLALWGDLDAVARPLATAVRLGLGHLTLAQDVRTLSGGERQRLRLARELARPVHRPALFILDEPTDGLHARDVTVLVDALSELVAAGHGVLVVDHDPALLACCDYLLELGPGAGPDGGRVVAEGTPEQVAAADTATAPYLREVLA